MNRATACDFLRELLTDHHTDRLRDLCEVAGSDLDALRHEVAAFVALIEVDAVAARVFAVLPSGEHKLREWADLAQIVAVSEQHQRPRHPVPTPLGLPCPDWCDKPAGHPFEQYLNTTRREHVHRFGDRGSVVTLEQIERSIDPATGVTDLGIDPAATVIRIQYGPGQTGYLTSAGARRLANQLNSAAEFHDNTVSSRI